MASEGGDLISCVFCDFCMSDANYQEHLQVQVTPVSKPGTSNRIQRKTNENDVLPLGLAQSKCGFGGRCKEGARAALQHPEY